jgi:hypothetical protein
LTDATNGHPQVGIAIKFYYTQGGEGDHEMSKNVKLVWLRWILAVKVVLTFLFWGLPYLLFPMSLLQRFGVPVPDDPIYLRMMGAIIIAFGVAYWYAWKDPVHNVAIVKAGVVDNGLVTLVTLYFIVFRELRSSPMLVSALLTFLFCLAFILLMPKTETAKRHDSLE